MFTRHFTLVVVMAFCMYSCIRESRGTLDDELRTAVVEASPTGNIDYFIMPESDEYDKLPNQDPNNPITKEKVELGKLLFFETGIAQNPAYIESLESYSCATCHVPNRGFLPGRLQGIADGGIGFGDNGSFRSISPNYEESEVDAQGNRPLTVMNVTYMTNTTWSGTFGANDNNIGTEEHWTGLAEVNHTGFVGLEAQNIEGMHLHRMEINDKILYDYGYAELFDAAFPEMSEEERYSEMGASFALSAYLRTILTNETPFQDFLKGQNSMTTNQKLGGLVFFGKGRCSLCHNSPALGGNKFYSLGTKDLHEAGGVQTSADDPRVLGRASFTHEEDDMYCFKVPQLYNLRDYSTFFHGSSKQTIEEVVDYKIHAQSENPFVPKNLMDIQPLELTEKERSDLVDFLTFGLYDYDIERYVPDQVLSGNCFPNNDPMSRRHLGCE